MVDPILEAPCVDVSRVSPRQSENPDAHVGVLLYRIRGSLLDIGARADRIIGQGLKKSVMRHTQYPSMPSLWKDVDQDDHLRI